MRTFIVVPTYNESANVVPLVDRVLALTSDTHVCVVDDSSPDGTSRVVAAAIAERRPWRGRVVLVTRQAKGGRGGAVREGLCVGLEGERRYDAFVEMDSDFSHDPAALATGLALLAGGADVVIGARYPDGEIVDWPRSRRLLSRLANALARRLIDPQVPDYTNGYRFYNRNAAAAILAQPQRNTGYIYLSESLAVCLVAGMRIGSFPIVFRNRTRGRSNTDLREIFSAIRGVFDVALWYAGHRRRRP